MLFAGGQGKGITWQTVVGDPCDFDGIQGRDEPCNHGRSRVMHLMKGDMSFELTVRKLPEGTQCTRRPEVALIELASVTHGWNGGQHDVPLTIAGEGDAVYGEKITVQTPRDGRGAGATRPLHAVLHRLYG